MLHEGAKKVQTDYGGSLPRTAKELKDLPGIGPYTAGSPCSYIATNYQKSLNRSMRLAFL